MPNLSIPDLIAKNSCLTSDAKLVATPAFKRVKDGQIADASLSELGAPFGWGGDTVRVVRALRSLEEQGYALIEEGEGQLEHVVLDQQVEVSVKLVVRVKPLEPSDPWSVNDRRYNPKNEMPVWDRIQVGRMVYTARVSNFMGRFSLTVRARHGNALGETTLVEGADHESLGEAWAWVDELIAGFRDMHARGEVLPGAAGDDPHGRVVATLVEQGWDEDEARAASEATIGEGDPDMRIQAATRWLIAKRPPKALPSPIAPEDDPDEVLFRNAAVKVCHDRECSRSSLRRDFGLSASRADDLLERLEAEGVIGPKMGAAPRKAVLEHDDAVKRFGTRPKEEASAQDAVDFEWSEDELFAEVARLIASEAACSLPLLKGRLSIDHQTAIVLLDRLQKAGVIDDMGNPEPKVLMSAEQVEAMLQGAGDE